MDRYDPCMGSKRERSPGVWELRVHLGRNRYRSRTFHGGSRAADRALRALEVELADVDPDRRGGDQVTVGEWVEEWFARESPEWSPTSTATARSLINNHIAGSPISRQRLADVRLADVERWLRRLRDRGLAPASQIRAFNVLRSAFEQAERWELVARNPAAHARKPRIRYEERHIPTASDLAAALEAAPNIHVRTLIWLAAATGGRRGQLVALRWSDFDLAEQVVVFHRAAVKSPGGITIKEPKGGRPIRAALDPTTVEVVAAYRRHRQAQALGAGVGRLRAASYVFSQDAAGGSCWYPDTATAAWGEVRSMVPQLKGVRLHDLRHSHATLLIAAGVDRKTVAGRLGHSQVSTTDRYTHPVTEADRAAATIIGRILTEGA